MGMPAERSVETIESLSTFTSVVSSLMCLGDEMRPTFWFRGHARTGWRLAPGVLRDAFVDRVNQFNISPDDPRLVNAAIDTAERLIYNEFRVDGASLLPPRSDPVDIYFTAQHHGLPTRLLDWTNNPLAALFFAASEHPDSDGEVIASMPSTPMTGERSMDLLKKGLRYFPISERHPLVVDTIKFLFDEGDLPKPEIIIPLRPDLRSGRMFQQGACFTLHMPGTGAIPDDAVTRYLIPKDQKRAILDELRAIGINWATLFPDIDHLCKEIRHRRKLDGTN